MNQIIRTHSQGFDDRFYVLDGIYAPSVTYILDVAFPNSHFLQKWVGEVGNEEAEYRKAKAANEGSAVHQAIDIMIRGGSVHASELGYREKKCLMTFLEWWKEEKPQVVASEMMFVNKDYGYGGTIDGVFKIKSDNYQHAWVVDYKTSKSIWLKHKVQVKAYQKATLCEKSAILHLGNTTKKGYSFLPVKEDHYFEMFTNALSNFKLMFPDARPVIEEFPEIFTLNINSNDLPEQLRQNNKEAENIN